MPRLQAHQYNPECNLPSLDRMRISKANAIQRRGRAGAFVDVEDCGSESPRPTKFEMFSQKPVRL